MSPEYTELGTAVRRFIILCLASSDVSLTTQTNYINNLLSLRLMFQLFCYRGDVDLIAQLISDGADVNGTDSVRPLFLSILF